MAVFQISLTRLEHNCSALLIVDANSREADQEFLPRGSGQSSLCLVRLLLQLLPGLQKQEGNCRTAKHGRQLHATWGLRCGVFAKRMQRTLPSSYSFGEHSDVLDSHSSDGLRGPRWRRCDQKCRGVLASWGMFVHRAFFFKRKVCGTFKNVIGVIASKQQAPLWRIDCDEYGEDAKVNLQNAYDAIRCAVVPSREAHLTLVTKIMLGVFGCVPAFDSRFTDTMRTYGRTHGWRCWFRSFNSDSLNGIAAFYREHHKVVDRWSKKTQTFDFYRGERTQFNYTKAKIVDIIAFEANGRPIG
jgi:hypothetical protein